MKSLLSLLAIGILVMTTSTSDATAAPDPENVLVMELKDGVVRIEMLPDLAPQHVEQIKKLTRDGFYDGIVFHRVIDGFMAQTGDPTGTGRGGSELPDIPAEFSAEPFERGVAGMARSQSPDSANSQFFITFAPARFLDKQYTVWGRVVEGMEYIDMIKKAPRGDQSGTVRDPDKIITLRIAADVD
ncbi:peptidylprolyl isomerase [Pelagibius litoralis]|uniref:Peptidyl-prolyl cis-trans isomerase n=2 Tax=Pelagibius litoralis TaxID=374515 RepID=A0A967KCI4_9PROT|nr:peptidylprolyl isomerase [Pelagibius litoralis]